MDDWKDGIEKFGDFPYIDWFSRPYLPDESNDKDGITWNKARDIVWERDKNALENVPICVVCWKEISKNKKVKGKKESMKYSWECGHMIDRCVDGSNQPSNLVLMCRRCNQTKPVTETKEEYIEWAKTGGWYGFIIDMYNGGKNAMERVIKASLFGFF